MVAKEVIAKRCTDYYWAAIKVARQTWRLYGQSTTIQRDEAEAEGLLALTEAAASERYDEARGTFGGFVKMAVLRAVRRHCIKAQKYTPVEEVRGEEPSRESQEGEALRAWAIRNPKQAETLAEYTDGGNVSPAAEAAMLALRKETGIGWYALRAHETHMAAKRLGINERRVRALADSGQLTGRVVTGQWKILTTSCAAYRERRVVAELKRKPSIRAVSRATHTSRPWVDQIAKRQEKVPRLKPGGIIRLDRDLIMSMLTDKIQHAAFWRRGKPCVTLIAQTAGCSRMQVYRLAKLSHDGKV